MSRQTETAFLPAALEIEQTPASPAGRAILWSIIGVFMLAILWASVGEVDIVAVAQGRIIPSGHSKTVQPLEIGTVMAIHVQDGRRVQAGEPLIELDSTGARADVERLTQEHDAIARDIARLRMLSEWLRAETVQKPPATQHTNDSLLHQQWREFQDRVAVLRIAQDKQRAEKDSAQRRVDKLSALLPIVTRRARDQKALADQKLLPEQQYLETEQERIESFHDLRASKGRIAELEIAIEELAARIRSTRSEFRRGVLERLEDAQRRNDATEQELVKAQSRLNAQTITAPVDGTVQQLAVRGVGAVVTPAQVLMVIVPDNETLEVEATLENKDIGFVEVGQRAEIKVDTFPFTRYGTIDGEIVGISTDAVADEQKGLVFQMRVLMASSEIDVLGKVVTLSPGMTVTVESKTGTRKMIEFFLSPLLRYADESVRER